MPRFLILLLLSLTACGDSDDRFTDATADAAPDAGPEPLTLLTGAPVSTAVLYESTTVRNPAERNDERDWIPVDVTNGPWGEIWIIQRVERSGDYDDVTECTERGANNFDPSDDDCISLIGGTVGVADPMNLEPATSANGRALLVSDYNALHFMQRPSAIAFGPDETILEPDHPGAMGPDGRPLITEPVTYMFPFATCPESSAGNYTDGSPFIGPSLWTADPTIYNGDNGSQSWSNGAHLDMVHATQYCTGIAWERDNVYWAINGSADAIDRYDFGQPHLSGHFYHDDATITRYQWFDDGGPVRVPDVPSNAMIDSGTLYVADSGNGRVIAMALDTTGNPAPSFFSFEGIESERIADAPFDVVIDQAALAAEWGAEVVPSGLGVYDPQTLVVANNASGHISLIGLDGAILRTIDTGTGPGLGGLTVRDGVIFFVQMTERRLYRIDVDNSVVPEG